jgi:D-arabinose 1-dehydrogenase-like Zn-dependent alcohol dehydrogenase
MYVRSGLSVQYNAKWIQEMNRSFVLRAVKDVAIEDRVAPKLKDPWDVIVQVVQTGICGSDISIGPDP